MAREDLSRRLAESSSVRSNHCSAAVVSGELAILITNRERSGGSLASHGVALVSHSRGADLLSLERLFDLLHSGKEADVVADAVHA